jgi:pyruvate,water dikinase
MSTTTTVFDAPGPGQWSLDRSHYPAGTTPIARWLMETAMEAGMARVFSEIGTPAATLRARFVNGFMYTRLIPLIGGDKPPRKPPPEPILKLVARHHPAFRRRATAAAAALHDRPWVGVVRRWEHEMRPALVDRNQRFQAVDLDALDDAALDAHVSTLLDHCWSNAETHFWLHGYDLGPIANYLHHCINWGIAPAAATAALAGASPSTSAPVRRLVRIRELITAAGTPAPRTLEEIRSASPEAAALLATHLAERGHHLVTGYDLDCLTLQELPGTVVSNIRDATAPAEDRGAAIADELRPRVPAGDRPEFDRLLADARLVMDLRDDNGPNTVEWPLGLLRTALLAAGRRAHAKGLIDDPTLALEVTDQEARSLCSAPSVTGSALRARANERARWRTLTPPPSLGPVEPQPSPDVLPSPLPEMVRMVQTAITHMGMDGTAHADPLAGAGVGDASYTGRVRRADSAEEALMSMEPGDVLVVRATSPAFNTVLGLAGAVVTADGGVLSHAAVLARELGIPAVVGARGALDLVDGATVEVDPVLGCVRVL